MYVFVYFVDQFPHILHFGDIHIWTLNYFDNEFDQKQCFFRPSSQQEIVHFIIKLEVIKSGLNKSDRNWMKQAGSIYHGAWAWGY